MDTTLPPTQLISGKWLRYRRLPTWRLWLLLLIFGGGLLCTVGFRVHGWLSRNEPLENADYYVVEGWAPDYCVQEGGRLFREDHGKLILTSGGPLDQGALLSSYRDFANVAAASLAAGGVAPNLILPAPCGRPPRERTRVMAEAVKAKLDLLDIPASGKTLNLISLGVHARRSHRVYQDVLGPEWKVGVHCVADLDYDPDKWWKTSEGARSALTELIAMIANRK